MKFIIYGTGGVGGYFGMRLAEAGNDVTFIARGKHLEAIQKNGLKLKSINGDIHLPKAKATNDIQTIKNPDVILITTKTWQIEEAAEAIKPILQENTIVISLLNGADNADKLCRIIDKKHVLGGLCKIVSKIEDYGVINHISVNPEITFGELDNSKTERVVNLQKIFTKATILNDIPNDIHEAIWSKFLFITTISAIGGLTRATLGEMRTTLPVRNIMIKTAEEVVAIAKAKNINLTQKHIDTVFRFIDKLPFDTTASLQRDILAGKPSELEAQVGTIHQLGKELNIPTPTNTFIYHTLLIQENKARKIS